MSEGNRVLVEFVGHYMIGTRRRKHVVKSERIVLDDIGYTTVLDAATDIVCDDQYDKVVASIHYGRMLYTVTLDGYKDHTSGDYVERDLRGE